MTTGTISSGGNAGGYTGDGLLKTWSGSDGKYESYIGGIRDKWNNYTMSRTQQSGCKASSHGTYMGISNDPNWPAIWTSNDDVKLQSKLVSAIRDHDFNLAVNIATGKQTVNMIVDTLSTFRRSFTAITRFDMRSACQALRVNPKSHWLNPSHDFAGRWLELQYGWLPFLSDCYEAMRAYADMNGGTRVYRNQVTSHKSGSYDGSLSPPNWSAPGHYHYYKKIKWELTEQLSTARSLGLYDPLSVAWEVIPYSFVVDWFLPVGSYLENLSILPVLSGRFLTTTYRRWNCHAKIINTSSFYAGSVVNRYGIRVDRAVSSSLTTAKPGFNSLPAAMSPRRVYSAIALASQAFILRK